MAGDAGNRVWDFIQQLERSTCSQVVVQAPCLLLSSCSSHESLLLAVPTLVLRGQQRITAAGNNTHEEKIEIQCDASPYPWSPAAPKGKARTVLPRPIALE